MRRHTLAIHWALISQFLGNHLIALTSEFVKTLISGLIRTELLSVGGRSSTVDLFTLFYSMCPFAVLVSSRSSLYVIESLAKLTLLSNDGTKHNIYVLFRHYTKVFTWDLFLEIIH